MCESHVLATNSKNKNHGYAHETYKHDAFNAFITRWRSWLSHDIAIEPGVVRPEMAPLDGATHGVQTKGPGPLPQVLKRGN